MRLHFGTALLWTWRAWANLAGVAAASALFIYALALNSAGVGAVVVVDGPATHPATGEALRPGSPLRVPLGEKIRYGLRWRYVEGGCESFVVASFTRPDGREVTELRQRRQAKPRAVGQPGREDVERDLPGGITVGRWRYRVTVESECPTRKPPIVLFAEFDLDVYEPDTPVIVQVEPPRNVSAVVPPGGPLTYVAHFDRQRPCPGEVVGLFNKISAGDPDFVSIRRPVSSTEVRRFPPQDIVIALPAKIDAGRWRYRSLLESQCGGPTRVDLLVEFEFEVQP